MVNLNEIIRKETKKVIEGYQRRSGDFYVIEMLSEPVDFSEADLTGHWNNDRRFRSQRYENIEIGDGVYSFVVDTGHPNGYELHTITDNAFIVIQNERTERLITILAARPGQIKRYWRGLNQRFPNDAMFNQIISYAVDNEENGFNNL